MTEQLSDEGKFEDDFGRKIDPRGQCPDGVLHDFKKVYGGTAGMQCTKCSLTTDDISLQEVLEKG